ncbi:hypothetical protein KGQ27_00130 [Patescibacteria group bacterium]|nr:hypothetical protein [Patescibacteria group bacterium]MDE1946624.1 hypothetical protein [Patescibacteria group bacterium]MDE2010578.1 hypothetical protein [Patescibacteria group bacterium]MDE2233166.1 hypothetical protein [Patescibacteria group bacterium]
MTTNANDIDAGIKLLLEKLSEEFEIVKRQGFPAKAYFRSYPPRTCDVSIPSPRWHAWARELDVDEVRFEALIKILAKEGFLEGYKFISESQ